MHNHVAFTKQLLQHHCNNQLLYMSYSYVCVQLGCWDDLQQDYLHHRQDIQSFMYLEHRFVAMELLYKLIEIDKYMQVDVRECASMQTHTDTCVCRQTQPKPSDTGTHAHAHTRTNIHKHTHITSKHMHACSYTLCVCMHMQTNTHNHAHKHTCIIHKNYIQQSSIAIDEKLNKLII